MGEYEQRLREMAEKVRQAAASMDAAARAAENYRLAMNYARRHYGTNGIAGAGGGGVYGGSAGGAYGTNGSAGAGGGGGGGMSRISGSGGVINIVSGGGGGSGSMRARATEPEPRTAPGSVTGYRWWTLPAPDWSEDPLNAEEHWPHGLLHGMQGDWRAGVNTARCTSCTPGSLVRGPKFGAHDPAGVPAKGCACGFWATWHWQWRSMHTMSSVPVFGVIKGWGRFRHGPSEFRVGKARILALHPVFTLLPYTDSTQPPPPYMAADDPSRLPPGWHPVAMGRARREPVVVRTLANGKKLLLPEYITQEQAEAAVVQEEAWIAVLGDRLSQDYGVPVFQTRNLLLDKFPPDPVYGARPRGIGYLPARLICGN